MDSWCYPYEDSFVWNVYIYDDISDSCSQNESLFTGGEISLHEIIKSCTVLLINSRKLTPHRNYFTVYIAGVILIKIPFVEMFKFTTKSMTLVVKTSLYLLGAKFPFREISFSGSFSSIGGDNRQYYNITLGLNFAQM